MPVNVTAVIRNMRE